MSGAPEALSCLAAVPEASTLEQILRHNDLRVAATTNKCVRAEAVREQIQIVPQIIQTTGPLRQERTVSLSIHSQQRTEDSSHFSHGHKTKTVRKTSRKMEV